MAHTRNARDEDAEILSRFDTLMPDIETRDVIVEVRQQFQDFAHEVIVGTAPGSRERSLALTALEESMHWTNKAIARHGVRQ
ncbi:hypothetical protein ACFWGP_05395 [Agromyces sp. NPDC127015]|uniref:Acb2/Tad1 domain-containing protein n=1 Tax=Agromyces sp. NPDC127015 TaxID=3347108 RepID=UPI00364BFF19